MKRKFPKTSDGALIDKVTFEWFYKAREVVNEVGLESFKASNG